MVVVVREYRVLYVLVCEVVKWNSEDFIFVRERSEVAKESGKIVGGRRNEAITEDVGRHSNVVPYRTVLY